MASLVLSGDTSGSITVAAPAVAGSNTQTLAAVTGTLAPIVSGTSQTAPPPTPQYFDFTGIPSWAKRITVMLSGVSTNGTSNPQIQLGTGSTTYTTSGYVNQRSNFTTSGASNSSNATSGFVFGSATAANTLHGQFILSNVDGNDWVGDGSLYFSSTAYGISVGGVSLGSALTAIRITTVNGTDTFDAGTINILYE